MSGSLVTRPIMLLQTVVKFIITPHIIVPFSVYAGLVQTRTLTERAIIELKEIN